MVALPVALAFGIASGLGAAAGLYGAIAVGFCASAFGGTKSQISGPTLLLALLLGPGRFVEPIPHAALAGILMKIGWDVIDVATRADTEIIVTGLSGSIGDTLDTLQILRRVPDDRIVETLDQAREIAAGLLDDRTG